MGNHLLGLENELSHRRPPGLRGMFALSFACHLVIFSLIIWSPAFRQSEEPVTFVDLEVLPVASPQGGTPTPAEQRVQEPPLAAVPARSQAASTAAPARARRESVVPGTKGTETGASYSYYIGTRLKRVFKSETTSPGSSPQVMVRITIGPEGQIAEFHVEKSSGDPLFDAAVTKAVTIAGWTFRPPPDGMPFERVYRFKPEGVSLP